MNLVNRHVHTCKDGRHWLVLIRRDGKVSRWRYIPMPEARKPGVVERVVKTVRMYKLEITHAEAAMVRALRVLIKEANGD